MKANLIAVLALAAALSAMVVASAEARAEVRAWQGTFTTPVYPWEEDINPKFWALEDKATAITPADDAIMYPYVMQVGLRHARPARRGGLAGVVVSGARTGRRV